jgi:hypothetical protein
MHSDWLLLASLFSGSWFGISELWGSLLLWRDVVCVVIAVFPFLWAFMRLRGYCLMGGVGFKGSAGGVWVVSGLGVGVGDILGACDRGFGDFGAGVLRGDLRASNE